MQHVDCVADVEAFSLPSWRCGPWTHDDPGLVVVRFDGSDRVSRSLRRARHIRYHATVRAAEAKLTIRLSIHLIALLVNGAVMPATEQDEVRERGGAALSPVADVVSLAKAAVAAREATAAVTMEQRPPQCRWNRAGLGPDLEDAPVRIVLHHHPTGVAPKALGRFCRTQHVAIATPRPTETQYAASVRVQRSRALVVSSEPDAEPDPGRLEVPRRVDTAGVLL